MIDAPVGERIVKSLYDVDLQIEVTRVLDELASSVEISVGEPADSDEIPDWRIPHEKERKTVTVTAHAKAIVRNRGETALTASE